MGPRAGIDATEKRKYSPCRESNSGRPASRYADRAITAAQVLSVSNKFCMFRYGKFEVLKVATRLFSGFWHSEYCFIYGLFHEAVSIYDHTASSSTWTQTIRRELMSQFPTL
jgi:hypothetical protein